MTSRVVFLDRDGVIYAEGGEYVDRPEDLRFLPGSLEAIAALCEARWTIVVFTNQSGVGRGLMTQDTLDAIHNHLRCEAARRGGFITAIYACPHRPEVGCECRKPKPGMLLQAARDHDIDLAGAYAVGDSPRDIAAARAAKCTTVLVLSGHTRAYLEAEFPGPRPDYVFPDLSAFASWLLVQAG